MIRLVATAALAATALVAVGGCGTASEPTPTFTPTQSTPTFEPAPYDPYTPPPAASTYDNTAIERQALALSWLDMTYSERQQICTLFLSSPATVNRIINEQPGGISKEAALQFFSEVC